MSQEHSNYTPGATIPEEWRRRNRLPADTSLSVQRPVLKPAYPAPVPMYLLVRTYSLTALVHLSFLLSALLATQPIAVAACVGGAFFVLTATLSWGLLGQARRNGRLSRGEQTVWDCLAILAAVVGFSSLALAGR
jgi:hypothetical protein